VPIVLKSESLNLLEPTGPLQESNGIAVPSLHGNYIAYFTFVPSLHGNYIASCTYVPSFHGYYIASITPR
jgi:hypothetical protein